MNKALYFNIYFRVIILAILMYSLVYYKVLEPFLMIVFFLVLLGYELYLFLEYKKISINSKLAGESLQIKSYSDSNKIIKSIGNDLKLLIQSELISLKSEIKKRNDEFEVLNKVSLNQKIEIEELYKMMTNSNKELNIYVSELAVAKEELMLKNNALTKYYNDIQTGYLQTVMALANSIEAKDKYTRGHCQRVMEISCEIAKKMGYNNDEIEDLRFAAILHDIGKIGISASIINKKGKLTDAEFDEIKKHPLIAYNILKEVEFISNGLRAILEHHERYDGKGYPQGIKGNQISRFGRILCIADAFDAMTSDRPYRKAMEMEEALKEIEKCSGKQFDPEVTKVFIEIINNIICDGIGNNFKN